MRSIAVYCGSSNGSETIFSKIAKELGHLLAKNNIKIIYGGGDLGLMGIIANAAFDNGGVVEGTITNHLADKEKKNLNLQILIAVITLKVVFNHFTKQK